MNSAGNKKEPEYIDRERAKEHLIADTAYAAAKMLDDIPAEDVVKVVHCKECKHSHWEQEPCHGKIEYFCPKLEKKVDPRFFCGLGKKRDGEDLPASKKLQKMLKQLEGGAEE